MKEGIKRKKFFTDYLTPATWGLVQLSFNLLCVDSENFIPAVATTNSENGYSLPESNVILTSRQSENKGLEVTLLLL